VGVRGSIRARERDRAKESKREQERETDFQGHPHGVVHGLSQIHTQLCTIHQHIVISVGECCLFSRLEYADKGQSRSSFCHSLFNSDTHKPHRHTHTHTHTRTRTRTHTKIQPHTVCCVYGTVEEPNLTILLLCICTIRCNKINSDSESETDRQAHTQTHRVICEETMRFRKKEVSSCTQSADGEKHVFLVAESLNTSQTLGLISLGVGKWELVPWSLILICNITVVNYLC
jgi:hypothetical protein